MFLLSGRSCWGCLKHVLANKACSAGLLVQETESQPPRSTARVAQQARALQICAAGEGPAGLSLGRPGHKPCHLVLSRLFSFTVTKPNSAGQALCRFSLLASPDICQAGVCMLCTVTAPWSWFVLEAPRDSVSAGESAAAGAMPGWEGHHTRHLPRAGA